MDAQKYKFELGLAGVLVLYVFGYLFMVRPVYTDTRTGVQYGIRGLRPYSRKLDKMLDPRTPVYSQKLVDHYKNEKKELQKARQDIFDFFAKMDQPLEKMFDEIKSPGDIDIAFFQTVYTEKKNALIRDIIEDWKMQIGRTFDTSRDINDVLNFPGVQAIAMTSHIAAVQKEYWIVSGLLDILKTGELRRLVKLERGTATPYGKYFKKISVEIEGQINIKNVPKLVENFLNTKHFPVFLKSLSVKRRDYEAPVVELFVPWGKDPLKVRKAKALAKFKKERQSGSEIEPVDIVIECEILDYEPQQVAQ